MANKHRRVNYIKNSVEERIGRQLGQYEFNSAYIKSFKTEGRNMQDRINAIVKNL